MEDYIVYSYHRQVIIAVCVVVNLNESEQCHSMGSMMDRSCLGPKTDRDHLEGNLGRYIQRNGKGKERSQWPWV